MNRLLKEKSEAKTVVAAIALSGDDCRLPGNHGTDEVLAQQHYKTFRKLFEKVDLKIEMLSASITAKERKEIS